MGVCGCFQMTELWWPLAWQLLGAELWDGLCSPTTPRCAITQRANPGLWLCYSSPGKCVPMGCSPADGSVPRNALRRELDPTPFLPDCSVLQVGL